MDETSSIFIPAIEPTLVFFTDIMTLDDEDCMFHWSTGNHSPNNAVLHPRRLELYTKVHTGCFTTCGHYCRRWFPRSLWSKSSYKRVSDFRWLRSYGHFLIPVHALVWTASYGTSWRLMYSAWWLIVCGSCDEQLAQFTTERHPVLWPVVAFSKTSLKHRSIQIKGNFMKLTLHLYFKCIMYYAGLLFCSIYCQ